MAEKMASLYFCWLSSNIYFKFKSSFINIGKMGEKKNKASREFLSKLTFYADLDWFITSVKGILRASRSV